MKKISIVTVVYNSCKEFKATIESIKKQTYQEFEYIVIDGESTDGTLEVIMQERRIDKYISESDEGIYDAMNKGISLASGEIILFLNAGDILHNEYIIENVSREYDKSDFDIGYGNVILVGKNKILKKQPNKITKNYLFTNNLCHQSMFFNKRVFNNVGVFDRGEKIFADYQLLVKSFKEEIKYHHFDITICEYDNVNGVSSKLNKKKVFTSRAKIVYNIYGFSGITQFILLNIVIKPINYFNTYFNKHNIIN